MEECATCAGRHRFLRPPGFVVPSVGRLGTHRHPSSVSRRSASCSSGSLPVRRFIVAIAHDGRPCRGRSVRYIEAGAVVLRPDSSSPCMTARGKGSLDRILDHTGGPLLQEPRKRHWLVESTWPECYTSSSPHVGPPAGCPFETFNSTQTAASARLRQLLATHVSMSGAPDMAPLRQPGVTTP